MCKVQEPSTNRSTSPATPTHAVDQHHSSSSSSEQDLTQEDLDMFQTSRFNTPESYTSSSLHLPTLTNPIHPIFAPDQWPKLSSEDYESISQSLRLASAFLASGLLDSFFHMLFFVAPTRLGHHAAQMSEWSDPFGTPLTEAQKLAVQARLNTIAANHWITFSLDPKLPAGAYTNACKSYRVDSARGSQSRIKISPSFLSPKADLPSQLSNTFSLATTLLHELAHAAYNLTESKAYVEPFVGSGECVAEIGFALEAYLFSGHLERLFQSDHEDEKTAGKYEFDGQVSELQGILALVEWPYQRIVNEYQETGCTIKVRHGGPKQALRLHDLAWRVPLNFLSRFFEDSFWEREVPVRGLEALRPAREHGYCFRAEGLEHQPARCRVDERRKCIPEGYARFENGDIGREEWVAAAKQDSGSLKVTKKSANAGLKNGVIGSKVQKKRSPSSDRSLPFRSARKTVKYTR